MKITTPSPENSEQELESSQEAAPKGSKTMMQRLRHKFKEMVGVIMSVCRIHYVTPRIV